MRLTTHRMLYAAYGSGMWGTTLHIPGFERFEGITDVLTDWGVLELKVVVDADRAHEVAPVNVATTPSPPIPSPPNDPQPATVIGTFPYVTGGIHYLRHYPITWETSPHPETLVVRTELGDHAELFVSGFVGIDKMVQLTDDGWATVELYIRHAPSTSAPVHRLIVRAADANPAADPIGPELGIINTPHGWRHVYYSTEAVTAPAE
ncbi:MULTISPECIES: hypothetical protein [unclassified Nocardia]|uniref:hypothetical protein n=1 Tax=unclassified Nocardia TaxID=2637762 RepID=UPI00278C1B3E|nr:MULTISPECIES: hypothetical protein [unclassified Nocardia]